MSEYAALVVVRTSRIGIDGERSGDDIEAECNWCHEPVTVSRPGANEAERRGIPYVCVQCVNQPAPCASKRTRHRRTRGNR